MESYAGRSVKFRLLGLFFLLTLLLSSLLSASAQEQTLYDLTIASANEKHGSIDSSLTTPDGDYAPGTKVTASAIPSEKYSFKEWSFSGPPVADVTFLPDSKSPTVSFSMPADGVTVTANFSIRRQLTVIAKTGGSIVGNPNGLYAADETASLRAQPDFGYEFSGWTPVSNIDEPDLASATFTMPDPAVNTIKYANFVPLPKYTVTTYVEPEKCGSISGTPAEPVWPGTDVELDPSANLGCSFVNWSTTDLSLTDEKADPLGFEMPDKNVTLTAHFEEVSTPEPVLLAQVSQSEPDPSDNEETQQVLPQLQTDVVNPQPAYPQPQTDVVNVQNSEPTLYRVSNFFTDERKMPSTGFPTGKITSLKAQPRELTYAQPRFSIAIPSINLDTSLVEVPLSGNSWAVDWLGENLGLLSGSAQPGAGVSYIVGHNHLNTIEAGPFAFLSALKENDRIFISAENAELQTYKVIANQLYAVADSASVEAMANTHPNILAFITCENESIDGGYTHRRVVFAEPC